MSVRVGVQESSLEVLFVAGFSPIVKDMAASKRLYADALGLPLEGDYPMTEKVEGVKHLGLWSLRDAAKSCFGSDEWPADVPVPQATIEFEVADVDAAAKDLEAKGYHLVHPAKVEPWKQTIARLISPEGLLVGVSYTPWHHESKG
jgi:catechol 2,3-dioxygenase-like lactoylglutathione lyase family enzyme